jgi:hypothetical protein
MSEGIQRCSSIVRLLHRWRRPRDNCVIGYNVVLHGCLIACRLVRPLHGGREAHVMQQALAVVEAEQERSDVVPSL